MIAEDGITDYGFAKRKAARQLGAVNADELPSNAGSTPKSASLAVFQDEEHLERQQACASPPSGDARTRAFRPYLTGAVLEAPPGIFRSRDRPLSRERQEVEIFFLNQNVAYEHREPRRPARPGGHPGLRLGRSAGGAAH